MNIKTLTSGLAVILVCGIQTASALYNPATGRWLNRDPLPDSPGPSAAVNPSAFVENDPISYVDELGNETAAAAPAGTDLRLTLQPGRPVPGVCGVFEWQSTWKLEQVLKNTLGGWIVQDITISWGITNCAGEAVTANPPADNKPNPLHYWEGWSVAAKSPTSEPPFDTFSWGYYPATWGSVTFTASASFNHGQPLDPYPPPMIKPNSSTLAGDLPASTTPPQLTGTATPSIPHTLTATWNCCTSCGLGIDKRTIISSHKP